MQQTHQHHESADTDNTETTDTAQTDETCPECDAELVIENQELICADCGLVVDEDVIDRGPEWRAFNQTERDKKSRVGTPTTKTMHDKGLSTKIGWQDRDANGNTLSGRKRQQMGRLRKWNERFRTKDAQERGMKFALGEIDRMGSALGVPDSVREIACVVYQRLADEDVIRGRSLEAAASACLYIGCRQDGLPKTPNTIAEVSRVERIAIVRSYRKFIRVLGLGIEAINPADYLPKFVSKLEADNEIEATAREIIEITTSEGLHSGKSPSGFAAAAIYSASIITGKKLTQREIAKVTDTTEVTIRNRYQEQMEIAAEQLD